MLRTTLNAIEIAVLGPFWLLKLPFSSRRARTEPKKDRS